HDIRTEPAERCGIAHSGRNQERVYAAADRVRDAACSSDDLGGDAAERAVLLLRDCKHVHQSTFASSRSRRTSSGTASAPSPTIRPGGRSGGGASWRTSIR